MASTPHPKTPPISPIFTADSSFATELLPPFPRFDRKLRLLMQCIQRVGSRKVQG